MARKAWWRLLFDLQLGTVLFDKFLDLGVVQRMEEPPDVELGEVEVHASIVAQLHYDIIGA